jgi:hypothetical protein
MGTERFARTYRLLAAAFFAACLAGAQAGAQATPPAGGQPAAPQVRMRWQDFISGPDGTKRLASLQAAITKMKSLDSSAPDSADFRRSWLYWANIHGYYGAQSPDGTVAQQIQYLQDNQMGQYVSYYQGIVDQTAPDATAQAIWATCQHSPPGQQLNFFGWHRMYLYYYERVLRWAAGDDTLRLPYWDYTDPAQVTLPGAFQDTTSSLYDAKRDPDMNTGASTLNPVDTNVNAVLKLSDYLTYEGRVEGGIHGYVHCTVGPTCPVAHMGDVPVAGNDPVFYSHHANIDRLWACWQKLYPTPAGSWQDEQFSFVDETGTLVTQPVKNFLDSTTLGYVYDNDSDCSRQAATDTTNTTLSTKPAAKPPAQGSGKKSTTMIGSSKPIAINQPQISVDLPVPKPKLQGALSNAGKTSTTELVLRDVTAQTHPGTLFDVFVEKKGDPSTRTLVGTISWFGAFRHHGHTGAEKRTFQFDITDQLQALGQTAAAEGLTVTLEASDGRVVADPARAAAKKTLAAKAFRAQSKLQIGAIELQESTTAAPPPPAPPKKK